MRANAVKTPASLPSIRFQRNKLCTTLYFPRRIKPRTYAPTHTCSANKSHAIQCDHTEKNAIMRENPMVACTKGWGRFTSTVSGRGLELSSGTVRVRHGVVLEHALPGLKWKCCLHVILVPMTLMAWWFAHIVTLQSCCGKRLAGIGLWKAGLGSFLDGDAGEEGG